MVNTQTMIIPLVALLLVVLGSTTTASGKGEWV
jgi:hypothetical protein